MSKIDDVFGGLATKMLQKWGIDGVTYIRSESESYSTETGAVTTSNEEIAVRAVVARLSARELQGIYQENDVKIIVDPTQIGDVPIKQSDWFKYPENGVTVKAKVVDVRTYRGDRPVGIFVIARPQ